MRKFFTSLKSVVAAALVAAMTLSVSCSYDDTGIKNEIKDVKKELAALTERVAALETQLASEVESLEALINGKVVVVNITENEDGSQTIKLSDGSEVTVLPACDHECTPCDCGDALLYRVENGVLEVSADGQNWIAVEQVIPEQVVAGVVVNEDGTVTITLATGEEINVGAKAELIEFEATRGQVYVIAGQSKEIGFAINDAVADINVMNQPFGWSAEVAAAGTDEGDNGDAGIMPLAAGGQNFVLKINGPSQELVNAGYAAKEGLVSVHFNTADGACKVANVAVNLAEITMTVDNAGNITITNTMATEQENYWGETFVDFADFFIGVLPKSLYDEYGADALLEDFQDWDYETAAATQRSTGLWNVADLQTYEEGVYEVETIEITVDRLAQAFYPTYNFEIGQEYIIFISLESELKNYYEVPVLDNAILASYKKVLVEASLVADSAKWNDATYHMSLAGFQYYLVGWLSVAEVEEYLSTGSFGSTVEEFLPAYINGNGLMSSGAIVADIIDEDVNLSSLAERSLMEYAPVIKADTEYYFYVYPFNAASEMELYQHEFVTENLYIFENFKTNALVAGSFEVAPEYELVLHNEQNIQINVTLPEGITNAYYTWFENSEADPEEALYKVMNDVYANDTTELSFSAEKYGHNGLPNPIYFALIAINEAGEYVYVEQEFLYVEPEPIALNSFEYLGRYYDLYDEDVETSGGDFIYKAVAADGQEFTIGLYYTFANDDGSIINGTYNYRGQYLNSMYGNWNGFVIESETYYDIASLIVTDADITLKLNGQKYVYTKGGSAEPEPEPEPEVEVIEMSPIASAKFAKNTYLYLYSEDGKYCAVYYLYGIVDSNKGYLPAGEYTIGADYPGIYGYGYSYLYDYVTSSATHDFDAGGVMKVSEVDGAYHIEFNGTLNDGTASMEFVFDGAIENLILPSEYVEAEVLDFTPVRAEYDFTYDLYEYNGGDSEYAYWLYDANNNYIEVICHYNPNTSWNYVFEGKVVVNGETYELTKITTQQPSNYNCAEGEKYFAIGEVKFANNTVYSYTGQLPAVEVNYLGEGSTYAPGSENQGGNEGGNEGGEEEIIPTELTITRHATIFRESIEHEIGFYYDDANGKFVDIDFISNPIVAGTYTLANGLSGMYCKSHGGSMTACTVIVTENADGTLTFDATFKAGDDNWYHFLYTAKIYDNE